MRYYNYFKTGEQYFNEKEYSKALKYFDKFIKFNETMFEGYENKAVCHLMLNNIRECIDIYKYMIKNKIGDRKKVDFKIQNTIGSYFSNNFDESKIDLVNELDIKNTHMLINICISKNIHFAFKLIIYIYNTNPQNLEIHFSYIEYLVKYYCQVSNYEIFNLNRIFMRNNNIYYSGLVEYHTGNFDKSLILFEKQKCIPEFENYIKDFKNINNFYYISSLVRSSKGNQGDYKLIREEYNKEINTGNNMLDNWFFFTVYNVFNEFNRNNAKQSLDYIVKINNETINSMKIKLITDFEENDRIKIKKIDDKNQIVCIKNCYILIHDRSIILYDRHNLYVGKKKFFPYTPKYIILKKNIKIIKGKVFSLNINNQTNYFHILIEILGRICILEKYFDLSEIKIAISNSLSSYGKEILKQFNFKEIIYEQDKILQCDELVFVDIGIESLDYQDCWSCYLPTQLSLNLTYERFISLTNDNNYVIYISRNETNIRNIENEEILIDKVLKPLYGKDLIIFNNEYLKKIQNKFSSQASLFNGSRLVIGAHGAALSNILFCKERTPVVEFLLKPNCNRCFEYIAKYRNLRYIPIDFITSFYHNRYTFLEKYIDKLTSLLKKI